MHLVGDPLEATIASLYPAQITWDEEPVFAEDGIPVAAGPALVTAIPALREGENGEPRIVVRIPNNQTTPWFTVRFTTPGLRARFELLDVAWAEPPGRKGWRLPGRKRPPWCGPPRSSPQTWLRSTSRPWRTWKPSWRSGPKAAVHKVHIIGHCHIDMNWLWTWDDTNNAIARDFKSVVELMDAYPESDLHPQPAGHL